MFDSYFFREKSTDEVLVCKTNRVREETETERVTVEFDLQARRDRPETFTFKPDPTISYISPLTSFHSGGRKITVEGTNLDIIQKPMMYYKATNMHRSNYSVSTEMIVSNILSFIS